MARFALLALLALNFGTVSCGASETDADAGDAKGQPKCLDVPSTLPRNYDECEAANGMVPAVFDGEPYCQMTWYKDKTPETFQACVAAGGNVGSIDNLTDSGPTAGPYSCVIVYGQSVCACQTKQLCFPGE